MKPHKVVRVTGGKVAIQKSKGVPLPMRTIENEIRALAREINLDRVVFHFKKAGKWRRSGGVAYSSIPWEANLDGLRRVEWRYLVVVAYWDHTPDWWIRILAHECKHVEQFRSKGVKPSERPMKAFEEWWLRKRAAEA